MKQPTKNSLPIWWYLAVLIAIFTVVALSVVRASSASTLGESTAVGIAISLILAIAIIGPAALIEIWIHQLAPVFPNLKELWILLKMLRDAMKEYLKAVALIAKKCRDRQGWRYEKSVLTPIYKRSYLGAKGQLPPDGGGGAPASQAQTPGSGNGGGVAAIPPETSRPTSLVNGGLPSWDDVL